MPTVSIITPSFNQGDYLVACLESVAAQAIPPAEHLIFDPGSTDGSIDVARAHAERHGFVTLFAEPDEGQVDAINKGFAAAKGEILTWLNSDDAYLDDGVLAAVTDAFEQHPEADVVYGRGYYVDPQGRKLKDAFVHRDTARIAELLHGAVGILQPALFFRRRLYEQVGGLDPTYNLSLDYEYWIRFAKAGARFHFLDRPLARATMHTDSKTVGSRGAQFDELLELQTHHYGRPHPAWLERAALHRATGRDGIIDTSRELTVSQQARRRYHATELRRRYLPLGPPPPKALVVTSFDRNYHEQGLNLIAGLHRTSRAAADRILVYDLGLTESQRRSLSDLELVEVVDYPTEVWSFFEGYMHPKNYSYKCAAIRAAGALVEPGQVVLWMDAGVTPLRPIDEIVRRTVEDGVFFVDHDDRPGWPFYNIQNTSAESLAAMGATPQEMIAPHLCSALVGYVREGPYQTLIDEAYLLSQDERVVVAPKHLGPEDRIEPERHESARTRRAYLRSHPEAAPGEDELRRLFGYWGHRQDQSIYSVLCARYGAPQHSGLRYNRANDASSAASKLNWESDGFSNEVAVSRLHLDGTSGDTVIYHHRGTFSNLDGLQHRHRRSDCLFILGNGPSLADVDLRSLDGHATLGMNAAYRYWHEIGWYPTYYACMDIVVAASQAESIADLVANADDNGIELFFLRESAIEAQPQLAADPRVVVLGRELRRRSGLDVEPITTGSHALLWGRMLGYTRMFLLGVDLGYQEHVPGAELREDGTLEITGDMSENPNYFFAGYQQPGDRYNIPNPEPGLHHRAWQAVADALPAQIDVFNLNPKSALTIFPMHDLADALTESATTRRSIVRTWTPPGDRSPDTAMLAGPYERGAARFNEAHALRAWFLDHAGAGTVMVDVGAHVGGSLQRFGEDGWTIHAIEPDPDNREALLDRIEDSWDVHVDERVVADVDGLELPFYQSPESTGVSGVEPFLSSHREVGRVRTVTLASYLAEHDVDHVTFLKIDTEGHDLDVLEGYPWHHDRPDVIMCEFEDRKTERLGYRVADLVQMLEAQGYDLLCSEWHAVIRYGADHDFRALRRWQPGVLSPDAWGNLIAFRRPEDLESFAQAAPAHVEVRAAPVAAPEASAAAAPPQTRLAAVTAMARRMWGRRGPIGRRLARWYLSPSGLLFLVALALSALALSGAPGARWLGLAAVLALAVFVPYKFGREQVRNDQRLDWHLGALRTDIDAARTDAERATAAARADAGRAAAAARGTRERLDAAEATAAARHEELARRISALADAAEELRGRLTGALREVEQLAANAVSSVAVVEDGQTAIADRADGLEAALGRLTDSLARVEGDVRAERHQRIESFAKAVGELELLRLPTGLVAAQAVGHRNAELDPLAGRRLIFCASSGRTGTHYLAQLLGTADHVHAVHESPPYMIGHHLQAVLDRPLHTTYDERRIKAVVLRATLAGLPPHYVLAETNHMFIKTFHDVVLNEFDPQGISVLVLRRSLDQVLKSLMDLGYFTADNSHWASWMHLPHGANVLARPPEPIEQLDDIDRAIGYLFDIEARLQRFVTDHPGLDVVEVSLGDISTPEGGRELLTKLRLRATERTAAIAGSATNVRANAKQRAFDLAECRSRIFDYHARAQRAGLWVPDLSRLLDG